MLVIIYRNSDKNYTLPCPDYLETNQAAARLQGEKKEKKIQLQTVSILNAKVAPHLPLPSPSHPG